MTDPLKADAQLGPDGTAALWVGEAEAPYATGLTETELWTNVEEVARDRGTVLLTVYRHDGTAAAYTVDEYGTRREQTGQNSYVEVASVGSVGHHWDDTIPYSLPEQPPVPAQGPVAEPWDALAPSLEPEVPLSSQWQEASEEPVSSAHAKTEAEDVKERIKNLIEAEEAPETKAVGNTLFTKKFLAIGAVSLVAVAAAITVILGLLPTPTAPVKQTVSTTSPLSVAIGESALGKLPFGFEKEDWTRTIDAKAAVSTFPAAVVVVTGSNLELLSSVDGRTIRTEKNQGAVSFVVATQLGRGPAVAWKAKGKLHAWDQKVGAKGKLIEVSLGPTDEVSNTGTAIIVRTPTTVSMLTSSGLKKLSNDPAVPVLAADIDGATLSSGFTGPLVSSSPGTAPKEVSLVKPRAGWKVYKWISATTQLAVVAWAEDPDTVSGDTRVLIVVHSASTGEATATIEADETSLRNWTFSAGKSGERAIYGPYMFELATGKLIADGTKAGVDFTDVAGQFGLGDTVRGTVVVEGTSAIPTTATILGLTSEGAMVVRTSSTALKSFSTKVGLAS